MQSFFASSLGWAQRHVETSRPWAMPAGLCVAMVLGATLLAAVPTAGVMAQGLGEARGYDIPAGPLNESLSRFAVQAGVLLSSADSLTQGRRAPPLRGVYAPLQGFQVLLSGSGLEAVRDASGVYTLRRQAGATAAQLAPVLVQGRTRDEKHEVYATPASVAVVTREEIDRLPPRNASDVLSDIPGVATSQTRQNPGLAVNIRGLQGFGRVNVMIDGARQNFQQSGHGDNGQVYLAPELLAQADVRKGPSAGLGGAGMIGGMVNFRTLEINDIVAEDREAGGRINVTSGTNNYYFAGSAAAGWRLDERWDAMVAVSRKNVGEFERGTRNAARMAGPSRLTGQDQVSGMFKLGWKPYAGHEIKLGYVGFKADFGEGTMMGTGLGVESRNHVKTDTLTLKHDWQPGSRWVALTSSVYYTNTRNDSDRDALPDIDLYPSKMHYETYTLGATTVNEMLFGLGEETEAVWRLGGEFYQDRTRPGAVTQESGRHRMDPEIMVGGTPEGERTVMSLFNEFSLDWNRVVELTGGLRYDHYGLRGAGKMYVGRYYNGPGARPEYSNQYTSFTTSRSAGAFAPSINLAVRPLPQVQLFASYGRGMRPPAITESLRFGMHPGIPFPYYPNPNLKEERARNWELGVNLSFEGVATPGDQLFIKAAWFDTKVNDYIVTATVIAPAPDSSGALISPTAYVNMLDPFRTRGLELQSDYDSGGVFASAAYSHSLINTGNGRYDPFPLGSVFDPRPETSLGRPSNGGANIWYVLPPEKKLVLSGGVRLFERRLTLGMRMRYEKPAHNASFFVDRVRSPSYHAYDVWANMDLSQDLALRLAVQNLRNEDYGEMNGGNYFSGPGRTAMATLSLRF